MSSHGKVQSKGNIPFSWEKRPGVCKPTYPSQQEEEDDTGTRQLLPPPSPSPPSPRRSSRKKDHRRVLVKHMQIGSTPPQPLLCSPWKKDRRDLVKDVQVRRPLQPPPPAVWSSTEKKNGTVLVKEDVQMQIPLPPCAFGPHCSHLATNYPSSNFSSLKGFLQIRNKQEDPFVAAFKECTRGSGNGGVGKINGGEIGCGKLSLISCRRSCSTATDDCIVRMSHRMGDGERWARNGSKRHV